MANRLSQNPIFIDTPGSTVFFPHGIKIRHMEWENYAAGATAVVNDGLGINLWSPTAASDLSEVRTASIGWVDTGFSVPTLTSGRINIFFY